MLREVFRTVNLPYMKESEYTHGYSFGFNYHHNIPPYVETLESALLNGLIVSTQGSSPTSNSSMIYLFAGVATNYWPSWNQGYWVFDGLTGKFFRRVWFDANVGSLLYYDEFGISRKGQPWMKHFYQTELNAVELGGTATALVGEEPKTLSTLHLSGKPAVPANHFKFSDGSSLIQFGPDGWAIDDVTDRLLNGQFEQFQVFSLKSGKHQYTINMPENIRSIALEDSSRCYVLLGNRQVILVDYIRNEILGAALVPALVKKGTGLNGSNYWNNSTVNMAWDPVYRRLLLFESVPDNPDGSCASYVRGFYMVNEPARITRPIPLKVPRMGRTVPVLVQVVDERNYGVGGYAVEAEVTGSGSLVGLPVTNFRGDATIQVACVGSALYSPVSPTEDFPDTPGGGGSGPLGVPVIGKPCWMGWFEFDDNLAYLPPTNCYMWVDQGGPIKDIYGAKFAQWIDGSSVEDIEDQVAATSGPAVAYWDGRNWPHYPNLRPGDWLALQAYCKTDETPALFEMNMRALLASVPTANDVCLVCQCYTSNLTQTTDLIGIVPVFARLARDYPIVTMLLVFSDQGRATGMNDHPEVKPYWAECFAGIPSAPGEAAAAATFMTAPVPFDEPTPFDGSPDNGSTPEPMGPGTIKVVASVLVSGVGADKSGPVKITGTPGPPGNGFDYASAMPESAPNMSFIVEQIYKSQEWNLDPSAELDPNGRGVFVEKCCQAMHDYDARWGHLQRDPGQNMFNGHASDSVNFKTNDGRTAEVFLIVTGSYWSWTFKSRNEGAWKKWYYPAADIGTGTGSGSGGSPSGPAGSSELNPIVTMSADPEQIKRDVTASWNHYHPIGLAHGIEIGSLSQWIGYASTPDRFSNLLWHLGHNRYWEDRMNVTLPGYASGSADPSHGTMPAEYRA